MTRKGTRNGLGVVFLGVFCLGFASTSYAAHEQIPGACKAPLFTEPMTVAERAAKQAEFLLCLTDQARTTRLVDLGLQGRTVSGGIDNLPGSRGPSFGASASEGFAGASSSYDSYLGGGAGPSVNPPLLYR